MIDRREQIEWDRRAYEDYLMRMGAEKERIAIVQKMLQDGVDIKFISKYLALSEDKILELKASLENNDKH